MSDDDEHHSRFELSPRAAAYVIVGLALLLIAVSVLNIYVWNDARQTRADLRAERVARLSQREQDERNASVAKVAQCRASIRTVQVANQVLNDLRRDHLARARQASALAAIDTNPKLLKIHQGIATQQRAAAALLTDFPAVTKAQCDALAKKLGVTEPKSGR